MKTPQTINQTNQTDGLLAAVAIPRVSLEKQVDGYSLESQDYVLNALGKQKGFYIANVIQDDGYSGADFSRPSIQQALKLIRDGEVQAVVWAYVDRFARDVEGGLALVKLFLKAGAKVLIGQLGWYEDTPQYKWQLTNWLAMAQFQKDDIAVKSRAGIERKIARNLAHGGRSPFGYKFKTGKELAEEAEERGEKPDTRPQNVHEPVPANIATVLLIGDLALTGMSLQGICRELASRGIKAPKGEIWNEIGVRRIIQDPCYYTGIWHYNKTYSVAPEKRRPGSSRHKIRVTQKRRPENEWKPQPLPGGPIMTESRWLAIQDARSRTKATRVGRPSKDNQVPMLRSVCVCRCGKAVTAITMHRPNDKRYRYYHCNDRDRLTNKVTCMYSKYIDADLLEGGCWNRLMDALQDELPAMVAEHNAGLQNESAGIDISTMEDKDAWLTRKIVEAATSRLMEDNDAVKEALARKEKEFKAQQISLRRQLASARYSVDAVKVDFSSIRQEVLAARYTKDPVKRQSIFQAWVTNVVYANNEAEMTLRVPVGALNSEQDRHAAQNLISLKLKVLVA